MIVPMALSSQDIVLPKSYRAPQYRPYNYPNLSNFPLPSSTYIYVTHDTIVAWNALPKSVVTSSTLDAFKVALGRPIPS